MPKQCSMSALRRRINCGLRRDPLGHRFLHFLRRPYRVIRRFSLLRVHLRFKSATLTGAGLDSRRWRGPVRSC